MTQQFRLECSTITNIQVACKQPSPLVFWLAAWLIVGLFAGSGVAWSLPVPIAWDVPLERGETYDLEIADSPGFSKTLLRAAVKGAGYMWEAPSEGVYHWRLMRPGKKSESTVGSEVSSLASGSFVIVDPGVKREQPARISWEPAVGADRYKIYVQEGPAKQRIMTVTTPFLIPANTDVAAMYEVVPFVKDVRTSRSYHLTPSLKLATGVPPPPLPPPPLPPPPLPVVKTTILIGDQDVQKRRRQLVFLFGEGLSEVMKFQKLATQIESKTQQTGGGMGIWLNPVGGLILSGLADYHEHQDDAALLPANASNSQTIGSGFSVDQSRFGADFSVGYNLLNFFDVARVLLTVSASVAVTQLPVVQRDYTANTASRLPLIKDRFGLLGGSASLGYLGNYVGVVVEGGALAENSRQGRYKFGRVWFEAYPMDGLAIELGAFGRQQEATVCASDPAQCLFYGQSRTGTLETGVILGIGHVVR